MIPVRAAPDLQPVVLSDVGRFAEVDRAHPLAHTECPACGEPLKPGDAIALVLVGRAPDAGWLAGSVAVHEPCAGRDT